MQLRFEGCSPMHAHAATRDHRQKQAQRQDCNGKELHANTAPDWRTAFFREGYGIYGG